MKISTRGRYALRMMIDSCSIKIRIYRIKRHFKKTGYFKEISGADYSVPEQSVIYLAQQRDIWAGLQAGKSAFRNHSP